MCIRFRAPLKTQDAPLGATRQVPASVSIANGLPTPFTVTVFERSRWRGGRFACYAPHVMPQHKVSNCGSRTCSFSKYRKTNSLQMGEKIEFP